ncbi:hypothetical protein ACKKBF_B03925 [Auxenochlorella protothecoides x Auxenochlorella symbiontica]
MWPCPRTQRPSPLPVPVARARCAASGNHGEAPGSALSADPGPFTASRKTVTTPFESLDLRRCPWAAVQQHHVSTGVDTGAAPCPGHASTACTSRHGKEPPGTLHSPATLAADALRRWQGRQWTVYRGQAYDLAPWFGRHPGGGWLARLAVHRDCTALLESNHVRVDRAAAALGSLPRLPDFPAWAVPVTPRPLDSPFLSAVRARVRCEVLQPLGAEAAGGGPGPGRSLFLPGAEESLVAAGAALLAAAGAYAWHCRACSLASGCLLGMAGAWVGMAVQHGGNHGSMSRRPGINLAAGAAADLIGGASVAWRYHHQVSHHVHCNDAELDEDVVSAYPLLRFDARLPRRWFHAYQHIYMWGVFALLQLAFQTGDVATLLARRMPGRPLAGAAAWELAGAWAGKALYWALLLVIPARLQGWGAAAAGAAACMAVQGLTLAVLLGVSHNVAATKRDSTQGAGTGEDASDWGLRQLATSADWGGRRACLLTGGLNLQVAHHLFPTLPSALYPAITAIVREEAAARGLPYVHWTSLPAIMAHLVAFMREVGVAEQTPAPKRAPA